MHFEQSDFLLVYFTAHPIRYTLLGFTLTAYPYINHFSLFMCGLNMKYPHLSCPVKN